MRRERLFLLDIVNAADAVARFLACVDRSAFHGNELVQSAVLHKLTVIGEAVSRLPEEFRRRHEQVPWMSAVTLCEGPDPRAGESVEL